MYLFVGSIQIAAHKLFIYLFTFVSDKMSKSESNTRK